MPPAAPGSTPEHTAPQLLPALPATADPCAPPARPQVPLCEPVGWSSRARGTILGYEFSAGSLVAIGISSVLGLLVNLSTFLVSRELGGWLLGRERAGVWGGFAPRPPGRQVGPARSAARAQAAAAVHRCRRRRCAVSKAPARAGRLGSPGQLP